MTNLQKYLFDLNPTAPLSPADRAALPTVSTKTISGQKVVTLTYREFVHETGLTIRVQTSPDLQNWTTDTNPSDQPQPNGVIDSVTGDPYLQAQVPLSGTNEYVRLRVTMP